MSYTTDRNNPDLGYGVDQEPVEQNRVYLVLSEYERSKGFVQPVRDSYLHLTCGYTTTMGDELAQTYARDPKFYGSTYCCHCKMHRPVGEDGEFVWTGTDQKVGTIIQMDQTLQPEPKQEKKQIIKKDSNGWIAIDSKEPPLMEWVECWEVASDGTSGMKVYRRSEFDGKSLYSMRDMDADNSPKDGKLTHWRHIVGPKS